MQHRSRRRWLGTALLAGVLAAGCRHTREHDDWAGSVVEGGAPNEATAPATPMPVQSLNQPKRDETLNAPSPLPSASETNKKPPENPPPGAEMEEAPPEPEPAFHRTRSQNEPSQSGAQPATKLEAEAPLPFAPMPAGPAPDLPTAAVREPNSAAHQSETTTIVGQLLRAPSGSGWRLRCRLPDKHDGGCVMLADTGWMTRFHEGQTVRVEGSFIPSTTSDAEPSFRVRSILVVDNP